MLDLSKEQKYILIILILILFSGIGYGAYNRFYRPPGTEIIATEPDILFSQFKPKSIIVHLSGAVKREGVFRLKEGARLLDAVELAGGFLPQADISSVNLAQDLKDASKVVIPVKSHLPDSHSSIVGAAAPLDEVAKTGLININTADGKALVGIPGVGEVTAGRIIEYRKQNGPFGQIEDIRKVAGIGQKKYEKMKSNITVN